MAMISTRQPGAALILALLAIVVLDCIVLGTLHIALQEQRIGSNRVTVLQLRLDAESGVRQALGLWSEAIDTMPAGNGTRIAFPAAQTAGASVEVERLAEHLFLLESVAAEAPPRVGRASARLLVEPPPLPPNVDPAPAPLSAGGAVLLLSSSSVTTHDPAGCQTGPAQYSVMAPLLAVTTEPGATLDAPVGPPDPQPLAGSLDRLIALAQESVRADGDTLISTDATGVLIVRGTITLAAGVSFTGILIATGTVIIEAGATVAGAVHSATTIQVAGTARWDPCVAVAAARDAGLDRPRPAGPRSWLPAF